MNVTRKSRKKSLMWKYFTCVDSSTAICKTCNKKCVYRSSVTNLKKHLERMHPSIVIEQDPGTVVFDNYQNNSNEKVLIVNGHDYQTPGSNNYVIVSGNSSPTNATEYVEIASNSNENNDLSRIQENRTPNHSRRKRQQSSKGEELSVYDLTDKKEYFEPDEDSEVNALAIVWAMDLRRMKPDQRLFAKRAIGEILFEGQMGTLHRNSITINNICHKSMQTTPVTSNVNSLPQFSITDHNSGETSAQTLREIPDAVSDEFLVFTETHESVTEVTNSLMEPA